MAELYLSSPTGAATLRMHTLYIVGGDRMGALEGEVNFNSLVLLKALLNGSPWTCNSSLAGPMQVQGEKRGC